MPVTLIAAANGNVSAAATFGVGQASVEVDSEAATLAVTNATQSTATLTGLSDVVDAIALKPSSRPGVSGTLTVKLRNVTDSVDAATVTVNITDLPSLAGFGWQLFQFAAVTLNPAKVYRIDFIASANSLLVLYASSASALNVARMLRTSTTGTPGAGDRVLVAGEKTGAGAMTTRTVTVDADLTTGGFSIAQGGTATCPRTASITRTITLSGFTVDGAKRAIWVYSGGTWDGGSVASPIPASSTLTVVLNVASNVESGIEVPGGTFNMAGDPAFRTAYRGLLNADVTAGATVLDLGSNWGLKANDQGVIGSTDRTNTHCERFTVLSDQVGNTITLSAPLAFAHSGSNSGGYDARGEVLIFAHNAAIRGASASLQGYLNIPANGTGTLDNVELRWLGSAVSGKNGTVASGGTLTESNCGLYEFGVDSTRSVTVGGCSGAINISNNSLLTVTNCNTGFISSIHITQNLAAVGTPVLTGNWCAFSGAGGNPLIFSSDAGATISNNHVCGSNGVGISVSEAAPLGTFSGNISHSNGSNGFSFTNLTGGSASGCTAWRNNSYGCQFTSCRGTLFWDTYTAFGNLTGSVSTNLFSGILNVTNATLNGGTGGFQEQFVLDISDATNQVIFENCSIGVTTGYSNNLVRQSSRQCAVTFRYCAGLVATNGDVLSPSTMAYGSYVGFSYYNQTNTHKRYTRNGLREFVSGGGVKLTPSQTYVANTDLMGTGPLETQVTSGQQVSLTVHVLKSASYNGPQPTLWLLANAALGINSDTLLATCSSANGVDEVLAANYTPTADGIIELEVRCAGTVGNVQVTRFTATGGYTTVGDQERFLRGNPEAVLV